MPDEKTDHVADVSKMVEPIKTPVRVERFEFGIAPPCVQWRVVDATGKLVHGSWQKEFCDALALLINRAGMVEGIVEAAQRFVHEVEWESSVQAYARAYEGLLAALAVYD
ncbi:MAG TPA: hypothetical protein VM223_26960, partial [Planctomycetota bacterium]|nr:hypothetical protein [Planctomycetota bacterium]